MNRTKYRPQLNSVLALGLVVGLFGIAALFFDFYYDLNDDVVIKDILSGVYSGSPDAHSIQMLYPLSLLISLLYRTVPALPWQGLFLCCGHGICFYLIGKRGISFVEKTSRKVLLLLTEGVLILTLFLWELVLVQYTITAGLLAACACFLVFTSEKEVNVCSFLKKQTVSIILVIVAFNIRSEMLLLMSPFIALTGILKWSEEKEVFARDTLKKYFGMVSIILLGMGLSILVDFVAYSGQEWKLFREFFDARTQVYDYTWYPEYEEAKDFYGEIGVTEAEYALINTYNFGLDEAIDAKLLWSIAEYREQTGVQEPFINRLKEAVVDYKWRTFHEQDAPYNFFVLTAYVMVAALALVYRDKSMIWKLPLAVIFRTIPWMYVILAKRVPTRISHPLYYIELIILCAWMVSFYCRSRKMEDSGEKTEKQVLCNPKRSCAFCAILLFLHAIIRLPGMWQNIGVEMIRRETVNARMIEFDTYAKAHPDNYYYMDVYSTVDFSEKIFEDVDNSQKNYDILGGWVSGSPLQKKATIPYQEAAFSRAELLLQDNFYYVCEWGSDTEFLEEFYSGMGIVVSLREETKIGKAENALIVYKLEIERNNVN